MRRLVILGIAAGPTFILSSVIQAAVRSGFDPREHPPSTLALGDAGWVQSATFIVAGVMFALSSIGLARFMSGVGAHWAPRCVGSFGVALAAGGTFAMDPAFGFPPGTPPGIGDSLSWHAAIHGVMFPLGFGAIVATCLIMANRFAQQNRQGIRWASILVAAAAPVLAIWPNLAETPDGRFLALWGAVVLAFSWLSVLLADVVRHPDTTADGRGVSS